MPKNETGKGLLYIVRSLEDLATNTSRDGVTLLQMTIPYPQQLGLLVSFKKFRFEYKADKFDYFSFEIDIKIDFIIFEVYMLHILVFKNT
jgi:hypothetical protein